MQFYKQKLDEALAQPKAGRQSKTSSKIEKNSPGKPRVDMTIEDENEEAEVEQTNEFAAITEMLAKEKQQLHEEKL